MRRNEAYVLYGDQGGAQTGMIIKEDACVSMG